MNERDEDFVTRAKELFDQSVESLDAETRSKLNRSRHAALEDAGQGIRLGRPIQWAPAAGVAAAAVLTVVILNGEPPVDALTLQTTANDFEMLLTEDSLEMLEELEFYSWIDLEAELGDELDTNGNVG